MTTVCNLSCSGMINRTNEELELKLREPPPTPEQRDPEENGALADAIARAFVAEEKARETTEKLQQKQLVIESLQERVLNLGSRATIQKNEIRRLNEVEARQKDSVVRQLHEQCTEQDCQRRNVESKLKSTVAQLNVRENTIQTLRSKLEANESLLNTYQENAPSTDGLKDALKKARADLSKKDGLVRSWALKCENLSKELQVTRKEVDDGVRSRVAVAKKSEELKEEVRMLKGRLEQCERAFRRMLEMVVEERESQRRELRREEYAAERRREGEKENGNDTLVGDEVWLRAKDISKRVYVLIQRLSGPVRFTVWGLNSCLIWI
ncbi:hypothetical protein BJ742DRAFT_150512 [Cladochytrium replicatum]|nr:hypothetical protein BJ742DRAFT_150512 [Cladochytrium replicatum]